jgi:hypothetical protein
MTMDKNNFTGKVWKLGCHWGKGGTNFYNLLKDNEIVICFKRVRYEPDDLIIIADGRRVLALAKVLKVSHPHTDNPELKKEFEQYELSHDEDGEPINYAEAELYELKEEEKFNYIVQRGLCQVNQPDIRNDAIEIWNNRYRNTSTHQNKNMTTKIDVSSKNTILYGPPGTGKTYQLNEYKETYFTDKGIAKSAEEVLREKVKPYPFWKILGAVIEAYKKTVSMSELLDNAMIKAKIKPEYKTPSNTIRTILQTYADDASTKLNAKYKRSIQLFHKDKAKWSIIPDMNEELVDIIGSELLELAANPATEQEQSSDKFRYNFITFHQKYSYEDFIEGIKPLLKNEDEEEQSGDLQFELKKGIFYNSCLEALRLIGYESFEACYHDGNRRIKFDEAKANSSLQFALFIDEINRANISAVFGELITLLEEDKRIGADNEMWVELPYSNEKFCVPGNLYVIGTMNTADRSIALLDIALRRRFEFKALYPLYIENEWWAALLAGLNQAIYNWKKNPDFFIGHAFFMGKPESDKVKILNTKIIPLLYEYCQNNADTVQRILKEAGVQIKQTGIKENFQTIAE